MDGCKKFPFAWNLVCILRISSYLNEPKVKKIVHTQTQIDGKFIYLNGTHIISRRKNSFRIELNEPSKTYLHRLVKVYFCCWKS